MNSMARLAKSNTRWPLEISGIFEVDEEEALEERGVTVVLGSISDSEESYLLVEVPAVLLDSAGVGDGDVVFADIEPADDDTENGETLYRVVAIRCI